MTRIIFTTHFKSSLFAQNKSSRSQVCIHLVEKYSHFRKCKNKEAANAKRRKREEIPFQAKPGQFNVASKSNRRRRGLAWPEEFGSQSDSPCEFEMRNANPKFSTHGRYEEFNLSNFISWSRRVQKYCGRA